MLGHDSQNRISTWSARQSNNSRYGAARHKRRSINRLPEIESYLNQRGTGQLIKIPSHSWTYSSHKPGEPDLIIGSHALDASTSEKYSLSYHISSMKTSSSTYDSHDWLSNYQIPERPALYTRRPDISTQLQILMGDQKDHQRVSGGNKGIEKAWANEPPKGFDGLWRLWNGISLYIGILACLLRWNGRLVATACSHLIVARSFSKIPLREHTVNPRPRWE